MKNIMTKIFKRALIVFLFGTIASIGLANAMASVTSEELTNESQDSVDALKKAVTDESSNPYVEPL